MKKDTLLVQCVLKNDNLQTTAWLEASKVKVGKQVLTSDQFNNDEEPRWWTIHLIGTEKIPYEKLAEQNSNDIWNVEVNKMRGNK